MKTTVAKLTLLIWFAMLYGSVFSQAVTSVQGTVVDSVTGEGIPYASIQAIGTNIGITSDINGHFFLSTRESFGSIAVSYIGYKTRHVRVQKGENKFLTIRLQTASVEISEVEVRVQKYRNKGNPAVELIRKVLEHKELNRPKAFDYYKFRKYEQVEMALNNIDDKTRNSVLFSKMKFIFEYADTNKTNGKVFLPFFFRELLSDVYYRKSPASEIEYIRGEYNTVLPDVMDNLGVANFLDNMSQSVDIYSNSINLMTVGFVSPLSPVAPALYRFYILDTSVVDATPLAHLYFAPRNKADKAFIGHMWVALDSTYAVHRIELGIPKDINLNWISEMQITQQFGWVNTGSDSLKETPSTRGLMLTSNEYFMDFSILEGEKSKSLLGSKRIIYQNPEINIPIPDSIFKENIRTFRANNPDTDSRIFLQDNRPDSLSVRQRNIIEMVDSLGRHRPFRRFVKLAKVFMHGYADIGPVSFGPWHNLYSFNSIEGRRLRLGVRTNDEFSKRLLLEGYTAYGFKDEAWKGSVGLRYSFDNQSVLKFPYNRIRAWYENDIKVPGQELNFIQADNFLLSFKRGSTNTMVYNEVFGLEYTKETQSGFSYVAGIRKSTQRPAGNFRFEYSEGGQTFADEQLKMTQLGLTLRYAPNEEFYQTQFSRISLSNKYPKFTLSYAVGVKGLLDGRYTFHSLNLRIQKLFYLAPLGYSKVHADVGGVIGRAPYLLLKIHNANQTFSYQFDAYNMMNFLEFVSDRYASVHIFHNFQGILFNRIPLIKKFKLREVASFKAVIGSLSKANNPLLSQGKGIYSFPVDEQGRQRSFTLDRGPYMEASAGISNIFRFFRVDYVVRLTYLNHPDISRSGFRFNFVFQF